VIGMVAFTYLFVQGLEPTVQAAPEETTTTTVIPLTPLDGGPIGTTTLPPLDAEGQAYADQVTLFTTDLQGFNTAMVSLNEGWDARELEYAAARDTLRDEINVNIAAWNQRVAAAVPPVSLATQHQALVDAAGLVNGAAVEVLAGLESSDDGQQRAAALIAFADAIAAFNTAADNAAAG